MYCESDSESESSEPDTVVSVFDEEEFTRQYTVLDTLGQGGTTAVKLCSHRLTGARVAVKALLKSEQWSGSKMPEVEIMKMLRHPNIVCLLQVIETKHTIYVIMEVVRGMQLLHRVQKAGRLKEDEARRIFLQLLTAIAYCHNEGVVHRDIKPDNVIVDKHGNAKILDFGLGARFLPGKKLERLCGAFQFVPPEIFEGLPYEGPKVDIWALGVILYYMTTGSLPFEAETLSELNTKVMQGRYQRPYNVSKDLRSMISILLNIDARERPNAQDILSHPWLQQGAKTFTFDSNGDTSFTDTDIMMAMQNIGFHRQDIKEALKHKTFDETMATYQLMRIQACQDDGNYVQTNFLNPGVTPFPSAADPDTFPLPPKRWASEPCLKILVSSTEQHHINHGVGTKGLFASRNRFAIGRGGQRPMKAPCVCLRTYTVVEEIEGLDLRSFAITHPEKVGKGPCDPERLRPFTSSAPQPRGWAKWKKRIVACIRTLCCCCMSPATTSRRKVCPQK